MVHDYNRIILNIAVMDLYSIGDVIPISVGCKLLPIVIALFFAHVHTMWAKTIRFGLEHVLSIV